MPAIPNAVFERGLGPRNRGGRFGRGAKPPSEGKYPRWIEFVAELPKTATGKIQRFKLRQASS